VISQQGRTSGYAGIRRRPPLRPGAVARPLSWARELLIVAVIYLSYEASRGVADSSIARATGNGRAILSWEQSWHLAPERFLNRLLEHTRWLEVAAAYFYSTLHYVVTPAVLIWMFCRHAAHYRLARTTLALSTVIGLVGYYFIPTAPPRLIPGTGISDSLASVSSYGWWSNHGSVPRGLSSLSNQFAAMPSLHVGWALWAGALLWWFGRHRITRWAGLAYPILTTLVVMATGNHYLLDAIAGAAAMLVAAVPAYLASRRAVVAEARSIVAGESRRDAGGARQPGSAPGADASLGAAGPLRTTAA
jgi:hypothetical protein